MFCDALTELTSDSYKGKYDDRMRNVVNCNIGKNLSVLTSAVDKISSYIRTNFKKRKIM